MADSVVLISDQDSEGSRSPPPRRRARRPSRPVLPPPAEIIDLTCEDMSTDPAPWTSFTIIDLTEDTWSPPHSTSQADQDPGPAPASPAAHTFHPRLFSTLKQETEAGSSPAAPCPSAPMGSSATTDTAESTNYSCISPTPSSSSSPEQNCSTTTFNSDLGSLASMQLDSDLLSLSPSSLDSSSGPEEETPHLCQQRELPPRLSPVPAIPTMPGKAQGPLLEASDLQPHKAIPHIVPARAKAENKVWLNKLHYFRRSGVQHLFLQGVTPNRETQQKSQLMPSGKLSMVHNTMEENFVEATLHFLNEFVSYQHCPPKEIISYLIRQILLNNHRREILKDTYMLLMKIQMLHPANATTVGWDWMLLKYIMEDKVLGTCRTEQGSSSIECLREKPHGQLLFLQYVVQTLEDDFQQNLRLRLLQKSIAKKVLSCDMCFNNVKEVVEWLVATITGIYLSQPQEQPQETTSLAEARAKHSSSAPWLASTNQAEVAPPPFFTQKMTLLLQRMLSIAVEVDKSPNCSSCKIADVIFPFILNIPLRSQREAFLNTMGSQLLRCKLLELLFQHSCDVPTTLPLSLAKILYFLSHSSVLLQYQDETATWQKWDEMLEYLSLLLLSYQNVILEHLRSSLTERMDLIIQKAKPKLQDSDDISHLDIHLKIEDFISRMQQLLGEPFPLQIMEKLNMLRELFLIITAT
ncbi:SUMO-interacting motif-containing protein 1 isoform X2 [Melopsittacus undulatus]|uniref:SUMO-interacting motif-containing protein 1 isoform X2 n=1 Tax=Melopsittacus undulatus TaxID=13146 RepID=UPI00146BC4D5|nr:SUMO-interacting motif-containing protein 1 isoform X2 [Melopsittacus undulatus]